MNDHVNNIWYGHARKNRPGADKDIVKEIYIFSNSDLWVRFTRSQLVGGGGGGGGEQTLWRKKCHLRKAQFFLVKILIK